MNIPEKYKARENEIKRICDIFETASNKVLNINGAWGTGKSYLSYGVEESLKDSYVVLRINISDYEYCNDPLIPFLVTILDYVEYQSGLPKDIIQIAKATFCKAVLGGLSVATIVDVTGTAERISKAVEKLKTAKELTSADKNSIDTALLNFKTYHRKLEELESAIKQLFIYFKENNINKNKIILSLDDFDRANPKFSFKVLNMVHQLQKLYATKLPEEQKLQFCTIMNRRQFEAQLKSIYGELDIVREEHYLTKYIDLEHTTQVSRKVIIDLISGFNRGQPIGNYDFIEICQQLTAREIIYFITILNDDMLMNEDRVILSAIYAKFKLELDSAWFGLLDKSELSLLANKICNSDIYTLFWKNLKDTNLTMLPSSTIFTKKLLTLELIEKWNDDKKKTMSENHTAEDYAISFYYHLLKRIHSQ